MHSSTSDLDDSVLISTPIPVERQPSTTEVRPMAGGREVEYFFASDASAVIEHTKQVIFLEDDDVAAVKDGRKFCFLFFFVSYFCFVLAAVLGLTSFGKKKYLLGDLFYFMSQIFFSIHPPNS